MDIYEMMHNAIYGTDFFQSAHDMMEFAEYALQEKNRGTLVKHFYQRLREFGLSECSFVSLLNPEKRYFIYDGKAAISKFMALAIPPQETPVKSLRNIERFAKNLIADYIMPIGSQISPDQVRRIMEYLDEKYDFSKKVFAGRQAVFAILDVSNRNYNSECLILQSDRELIQHFFLYSMNGNDAGITPEAVLFHELGHAIHARYAGTICAVPENVLRFLKELCMPGIMTCSEAEQCEVFADVLSVGLMYESPFAEFDPFEYMHSDDKKAFKQMLEVIFDNL